MGTMTGQSTVLKKFSECATSSVSRFGPVVRRKAGERTTSVRFPVSTLPSLQKLWFKDAVFSEPVWPSGKALGW